MCEAFFSIRPLLDTDLVQAAALEQSCFGPSAWSADAFAQALRDKNALYLVALSGEELIGCCGIWQSFEDGEIMNVSVKPEYRRRGVAVRMLTELMERSRERGIRNFTLEVREGNLPAVRLYGTLGFITEGIRRDFYEAPRENALIMWKR